MYVGCVGGGALSERALRMSGIQARHCCSAPPGKKENAEGFRIKHPQELSLARSLALSVPLLLALSRSRSASLSLALALFVLLSLPLQTTFAVGFRMEHPLYGTVA